MTLLRRILIILLILETQVVLSQVAPAQANQSVRDNLTDQQASPVETSPCLQPAPLFSAADYQGPLKKLVVYFARKPEIKTVHAHLRPGVTVCSLDASAKFQLFKRNTVEPVTFIAAAFDSSLAQMQDDDPSFGQGTAGYAKRYGASLADAVSSDFFHTYLFPVMFQQDPRYYRRGEGSNSRRLGHALSHVFVAESDSGGKMFNFSELLGTTSSVVLSNTYHPGNTRGLQPAAKRIGLGIASDMGFDVLREFWPEVVHTLKLPFKEREVHIDAAPETRP